MAVRGTAANADCEIAVIDSVALSIPGGPWEGITRVSVLSALPGSFEFGIARASTREIAPRGEDDEYVKLLFYVYRMCNLVTNQRGQGS